MKTLTEIESDVETLSPEQKYKLYRFLEGQLKAVSGMTPPPHRQSVLDIAPVHLGTILKPLMSDDDLLDEKEYQMPGTLHSRIR